MAFPKVLYASAVVLAAAIAAAVVGVASFAMGLVVAEWYLLALGRPVAALLTAIAAALGAAWTANLLAPDRSRTRLVPTLGWSALGAAAGLVVLYAYTLAQGPGPVGIALVVLFVLVTLGASFGALRSRRPRSSLRRDAWVSLALVLALPGGLYGAVGLACLLEACGA